jgi:hypothetical protein
MSEALAHPMADRCAGLATPVLVATGEAPTIWRGFALQQVLGHKEKFPFSLVCSFDLKKFVRRDFPTKVQGQWRAQQREPKSPDMTNSLGDGYNRSRHIPIYIGFILHRKRGRP